MRREWHFRDGCGAGLSAHDGTGVPAFGEFQGNIAHGQVLALVGPNPPLVISANSVAVHILISVCSVSGAGAPSLKPHQSSSVGFYP
jgi:hypothetical protein